MRQPPAPPPPVVPVPPVPPVPEEDELSGGLHAVVRLTPKAAANTAEQADSRAEARGEP
jgi:hypothetical protein